MYKQISGLNTYFILKAIENPWQFCFPIFHKWSLKRKKKLENETIFLLKQKEVGGPS